MGALSQAIRTLAIRKLGRAGWQRNVDLIGEIWTRIEEAIDRWTLPLATVRLYQDGLPVCGRELEIVTDLACAGGRNHQLLLRLQQAGATLMGTESPELLVQEYQLVKSMLQADHPPGSPKGEARYRVGSQALLDQRDRAIARRISDTLLPGETALLFLGMLHSVEPHLPADIEVTHPVFPPDGREDREP